MATVKRRFALAALLAVLVVATAAAGVDGTGDGGPAEADGGRSSGIGIGSDTGIGVGDDNGTGISTGDTEGGNLVPEFLVEHLISIVIVLSVSVPVVYAAVIVWQDGIGRLVSLLTYTVQRLVTATLVIVGVIVALYFLLQLLGDGGGGLAGTNPTTSGIFGDPSGSATISVPSLPASLLVVAALVAISVLVLFSDRASTDSSIAAALSGGSRRTKQVVHDGADNRVRSRATFDDVEATNDVYRAWRDLSRAVGVTDQAHTPREVARRATERGFDEDAVDELTTVFREVRYSSHSPTAEQERQARAAAERLQPDEDVPFRESNL